MEIDWSLSSVLPCFICLNRFNGLKGEGEKMPWNLFEKVWLSAEQIVSKRTISWAASFNIYDSRVCIFLLLLLFFFSREKDSLFESCWKRHRGRMETERVNRSRRFATTNAYTPLPRRRIVVELPTKINVAFLALPLVKKLDEILLIPIFRKYRISRILDKKREREKKSQTRDRAKINRENTYSTFIKRKIIGRIDGRERST